MWPGAVLLSALALTEPHAYYIHTEYMIKRDKGASKEESLIMLSMHVKNH